MLIVHMKYTNFQSLKDLKDALEKENTRLIGKIKELNEKIKKLEQEIDHLTTQLNYKIDKIRRRERRKWILNNF